MHPPTHHSDFEPKFVKITAISFEDQTSKSSHTPCKVGLTNINEYPGYAKAQTYLPSSLT